MTKVLNVIERADGNEVVGYISGVRRYYAEKISEYLNTYAQLDMNTVDDDSLRNLRRITDLFIDLCTYEDTNSLVKISKDKDDGYYYINILY